MKKIIAFILAMVMCLAFCACGSIEAEIKPQNTVAPTAIANEAEPEPVTDAATEEIELVDGVRPAFQEAMDAYEAFYDEYCAFMEEYSKNPADMTLLAKYGEMLIKLDEMNRSFEEWDESEMNDAELKYYMEVNSRVLQKMSAVTASSVG